MIRSTTKFTLFRSLASRRSAAPCFSTYSAKLAAINFAMPAMSPTMTEGGIVEWKFKEGEKFSAGDVLLEIETDKAQIDVEAQDDGIIAKIYVQDGEKNIPVGKTIAAIAEPADDLSSLELPEPEASKQQPKTQQKEEPKKETVVEAQPQKQKEQPRSKPASPTSSTKADPNQTLLPSVQNLLKQNDISTDKALQDITPSGPNGRILKGDVLAYIGAVSQDSVAKINENIKKLQSLDLSNIQLAKPQETKKTEATKEESAADKSSATPAVQPIKSMFTLAELVALQENIGSNLGGTSVSIESLVNKAVKLALRDSAKFTKPKRSILVDPVFESLLASSSRAAPFSYEIAYPKTSSSSLLRSRSDIYDILGSSRKPLTQPKSARVDRSQLLTLTVTPNSKVQNATEKANVFLDRLGYYLAEGKGDLLL